MLESLSLDGKTTIVTGGGTGLGLAMVRALARAGSDVAIASRRQPPLERAAQEVRDHGRKALAIATDVSDSSQVNEMVAAVLEEFGKIDVLVNNAGRTSENAQLPIWEISDDEWRGGLEVNLSGAFFCARAVSRHMVERSHGKIINVASGFGLREDGTYTPTRAARAEWYSLRGHWP